MTQELSDQEKITNYETLTHINVVRKLLSQVMIELIQRADAHDATKLEPPELPIFVEYTPQLAGCTYGSEEYQNFLKEMQPALEHHYAENRHHPEYFPNGINDMTLVDLLEMVCDWKAATLRHKDGDFSTSIERNKARFGISDQLAKILHNTVEFLDDLGGK
jgi:hypothetical protein